MNTAIPIDVLRGDAPAVLLGVLILFAGAMSCLLFAVRPRPRDSALLYFAIAASMYGLRLIATTRLVRQGFPAMDAGWDWIIWLVSYTIFIPFTFFFISTVAPQWRRPGSWIVAFALGGAVFGVAARVVGAGHAADIVYRIEVVLYLPLLALMLFLPRRPAERQLWVVRVGFLVAFSSRCTRIWLSCTCFPVGATWSPWGFWSFFAVKATLPPSVCLPMSGT